MSGYAKNVAINAFSNWGALFIGMVTAFIMSPIIVKSLGDTNYGIWSLMTSLGGYLMLLDLGIGSAVTRYVSKAAKTGDAQCFTNIFNSALALFLAVGTIIILCSPAIAWITASIMKEQAVPSATLTHLVILICIDVAIIFAGTPYRGCFQGIQRYDLVNAVTISISLVKAVAFYHLLKSGYRLIAMGYVILIGDLAVFLGYMWMVRFTPLKLPYSVKSVKREGISELITYGKFTFVNMIGNQVIYYSDSFVIGAIISVAAVTYYSIGWSLVEYLKKFCVSFSRVFVPIFSEMDAVNDSDGMRKVMFNGGKAALFLSMPLCLSLLLVGDDFVRLWMGERYARKAYPIMVMLLVPQFFEIPQQINYSLLFGVGKHKFLSYANAVSGSINLLLSLALAYPFGLAGVAFGTALPQVILNGVVIPWYVCKEMKTTVWSYYRNVYLKTLLPAAVFCLVLGYLSLVNFATNYAVLIFNCVIAFVAYLGVFYWVGLRREEKQFVHRSVGAMSQGFSFPKVMP